MYVYAQLGIQLPHFAAAQFGMGVPVPKSQLQPGDLVFFDNLNHVGIYIGGGDMVHAPETGDVVKIEPISDFGNQLRRRPAHLTTSRIRIAGLVRCTGMGNGSPRFRKHVFAAVVRGHVPLRRHHPSLSQTDCRLRPGSACPRHRSQRRFRLPSTPSRPRSTRPRRPSSRRRLADRSRRSAAAKPVPSRRQDRSEDGRAGRLDASPRRRKPVVATASSVSAVRQPVVAVSEDVAPVVRHVVVARRVATPKPTAGPGRRRCNATTAVRHRPFADPRRADRGRREARRGSVEHAGARSRLTALESVLGGSGAGSGSSAATLPGSGIPAAALTSFAPVVAPAGATVFPPESLLGRGYKPLLVLERPD